MTTASPWQLAADAFGGGGGHLGPYRQNFAAFATDLIRWPPGESLAPYQAEILEDLPTVGRLAVRSLHGVGKDLDVATPLPTPSGWTTMGEVVVGTELLDEAGLPCRVIKTDPPQWRPAFEVVFADRSIVVAGEGHLWCAVDIARRPKGVTDWRERWDATTLLTTREMAQTLRYGSQPRWRVPTARALVGTDRDLPIDPYLLGVWLGDGGTTSGLVFLNRADAPEIVARLPVGHIPPSAEAPNCIGYRIPGLYRSLRLQGFLGHKHIPTEYLRASVEQRRELVRGLWDTDGYSAHSGSAGIDEITLTCKTLALDVVELLHSLGLVVRVAESDAKLNGRVVGRRWRLNARFDFRPYHLSRYPWAPAAHQASRHTQRTVTEVRSVGDRLTRCIAVDSPRRLFLAGDSMIPTHNSATAALAVLAFACTRDGDDWKAPTTASAWRQLTAYLWPEIHKWARRLRFDRLGRTPFDPRRELLKHHLRLWTGEAFAVASDDPASIEGAHADRLLFVYDEAKAIGADIFDATEGAFSGAGPDTGREALALAISTPGEPHGKFYDIHRRASGTALWKVRHVTLSEAIAAGRVSASWAKEREVEWGRQSALYQNRVLGEFASAEEDTVIPLEWVEAANERWRAMCPTDADGRPDPTRWPQPGDTLDQVGVDVARSGAARTVLALRWGQVVGPLRKFSREDTMATTGRVAGVLGGLGGVAVVDVVGIGAGVVDRLREQNLPVVGFGAAERSDQRDHSGEMGFVNKRACAWWRMRELLDPTYGEEVALPPDDDLIGDLTAPKWRVMSNNRIQIEAKEDIAKRLGRSTDAGDAVVQAFWTEPVQRSDEWSDLADFSPGGVARQSPWRMS